MGLIPTKTKFRKYQRRRVRGKATGGSVLNFGEYGLQALKCGHLTTNQIEAARKAVTHYLKRGGKLWLRVCADKVITARAAETRMGGGKGAPIGFVAPVRRGRIIFEIAGIDASEARQALRTRLGREALAALKESHRHRPITMAYRAMTDVYKHLLVEPGREIAYLKAEDQRLAKMDYHRLDGAEILRCRYEVLVLITRLYEAILRNQNLPQVSADAARTELARTRAEAGELTQEMELLIAQWR